MKPPPANDEALLRYATTLRVLAETHVGSDDATGKHDSALSKR
ncbi:MAG: hypothetical protein ACT4NY_15240 [Pseudonocardiales bacterium]